MLRKLASELEKEAAKIEGDGKAEFLPDMTDAEYAAHVHEVENGWKPFMDRVLGRTPDES